MDGSSPQIALWAIAAGVSVACIVYLFVVGIQSSHEQMKLFRAMGRPAVSPFFKVLRPLGRWLGFFVVRLSARVEIRLGRPSERSFLLPLRVWAEKKLRSSAHPEGVTADEFLGLVILAGLFGMAIGVLLNLRMEFGPLVLLFIFGGMYWPLLWVRGRVRRRQDEISRGLPFTLDLLTLSVEAGLDFTQALARIVKKLGNSSLAMELGQTLRDIQLGRTRPQALRELSNRVDLPELNGIVSALIQADELGTSLGPILRIQADQLRQRRSQRAEKTAMEAPVKILLPLILFIFPTIFIMIFGPIALKLLVP